MRKLLASILIVLALAVTASAQTAQRPLPQFVESLSDADYATWVQWQNRQAERRSAEKSDALTEPRYDYARRVESQRGTQGRAYTRTQGSTFNGGRTGHSQQRRGATVMLDRRTTSVATARIVRLNNPNYVGPGTLTTYNPWVRLKGGKGTPDWDNIFVPTKEGTRTVSEFMDTLTGPHSAERVFTILISEYFSEAEVK